ncbi:plasmid mobilization relaxosome protein MobC [Amycolatopsis lurida]
MARLRASGAELDRVRLDRLHESIEHLSRQLIRIGTNLNQIAVHANTDHEVASVREQALAILAVVRRRVAMSHALQADLRRALR